jgi:hypothetical protein
MNVRANPNKQLLQDIYAAAPGPCLLIHLS